MLKYNDCNRRLAGATVAAALLVGACAWPPPAARQAAPTRRVARPAASQALPLRNDAPRRTVVKKGDTLWAIAARFLDEPRYWPQLWYANPRIDHPDPIYSGDVLELVQINGRARLRRAPAGRSTSQGTEVLSPTVRELPIAAAIPTIGLDAIRQFLHGPRLVTPKQIDRAPYVLQFLDEHLVGSAGNEVYVRGLDPGKGSVYTVVRPGKAYRDPDSNDILGYRATPVATAKTENVAAISTVRLTRSFRETLVGDRLLPVQDEQALASDFYPHAPDHEVAGDIISVFEGVSRIGQYQIVTLDRGSRQNIRRGDVLDIYQAGRQTRDPVTGESLTLPPLKAGTLMVFKVEQRVSFALVMRATRAIHVYDSVGNPEDL